MKISNDKKYLSWGLTTFLVVCGCILFYYALFHLENIKAVFRNFFQIIMPIVDGFVLAYLLSPIINFVEKKLMGDFVRNKKYSEKSKKRVRALTITFTMVLCTFLVYEFFKLIIPELKDSIEAISEQFPQYKENFEKWLSGVLAKNPQLESVVTQWWESNGTDVTTWLNENVFNKANDFLLKITSGIFGALTAVWNFIIGVIISIYLLYNKETFLGQAKKLVYAVMKRTTANAFIHNVRFTNKTFIGFIIGKIVDSIIIGILCFILTKTLNISYASLISVVVGVTNVIPFFGPYIGAIPCAILVLMVDPMECLKFVIMIFLLQQFDGNILGPKILGNSTGIGGFWVIFSITLFGGLWGVLGMVVGVPLFAVIYTGVKAYVNAKLQEKKLVTDTTKYIYVDYIDEKHDYIKIPREQVLGLVSKIVEGKQQIQNAMEEKNNEQNNFEETKETAEKK